MLAVVREPPHQGLCDTSALTAGTPRADDGSCQRSSSSCQRGGGSCQRGGEGGGSGQRGSDVDVGGGGDRRAARSAIDAKGAPARAAGPGPPRGNSQ